MRTIYLILEYDVIYYPPVLSIVRVLLELGNKVVLLANYSDIQQKELLKASGVIFYPVEGKKEGVPLYSKLIQKIRFRRKIYKYLYDLDVESKDYIWIFHMETLCLLNKLPERYSVIFHPFEFVETTAAWKYRFLFPFLNISQIVRKTKKVVCCEYNRAQITKGIFDLKQLPYILPNKAYMYYEDLENVPNDIREFLSSFLPKLEGKRVILYHEVFMERQRRLEEFCEAIQDMPDNYVLLAMGKGSEYYENLKMKYQSEKIIFIPFIRPPFHLLVTQKASIGVLTYFPNPKNISFVINPLYCAPNKIFEYARYGIPMISNDIPGLYYIFMQYKCGETVIDPMNIEMIKHTIEKIFSSYADYSDGSRKYYNSVNVKEIVERILL